MIKINSAAINLIDQNECLFLNILEWPKKTRHITMPMQSQFSDGNVSFAISKHKIR